CLRPANNRGRFDDGVTVGRSTASPAQRARSGAATSRSDGPGGAARMTARTWVRGASALGWVREYDNPGGRIQQRHRAFGGGVDVDAGVVGQVGFVVGAGTEKLAVADHDTADIEYRMFVTRDDLTAAGWVPGD